MAGGVQTNGIVRYNMLTNTWSALGTGLGGCTTGGFLGCSSPVVNALAISGSYLYVGGDFSTAGGGAAHDIARFNFANSTWSDVGGGVSCINIGCGTVVNAMAFDGSTLVVGGSFVKAGTYTTNNVAEWSGSAWSALYDSSIPQIGVNSEVHAIGISSSNSDIYVGGAFTTPFARITRWNGSQWYAVGSGSLNGVVYAIDDVGSNLYIGGSFTNAGGSGAYLARSYKSGSWATFGGSVDGIVRALADNTSELLVGGDFVNAGAVPARHVVRWTGSQWLGLGSGAGGVSGFSNNPTVDVIVVDGMYVYLGGTLRSAGPIISDNVAIWGGYKAFLPLTKK